MTAAAGCAWTADTGDSWITITAGAGGTGTAAVTYSIATNKGVDERTGMIRVGDATFSVVQRGDTPACEFQVAPVQVNACMAVPHDLSVNLTTGAACGWSVTSDTPWVSLIGGGTRSGPGEILFRVSDNYDAPRLGVVKVRWDTPTAGQNVQVAQAGCRYGVSASVMSVPADGGAFSFNVYQQSDPLECGGALQNGCVWSAKSDMAWLAITSSMPRAGDDRVNFTAPSNSGAARTATITVGDKTVVVTQAAR